MRTEFFSLLTFEKLFILSAANFAEPFPDTFLIPRPKHTELVNLTPLSLIYVSETGDTPGNGIYPHRTESGPSNPSENSDSVGLANGA